MPLSTSVQRKRGSSFVIDYQPREFSKKHRYFSEKPLHFFYSSGSIRASRAASAARRNRGDEIADPLCDAAAKIESFVCGVSSYFPIGNWNHKGEELGFIPSRNPKALSSPAAIKTKSKSISCAALSCFPSPSEAFISPTFPPSFPDIRSEEKGMVMRHASRNRDFSFTLNDKCNERVSRCSRALPLIPPKAPHLKGKLTVVLDLDETLVYARRGPLYVRPGIEALLSFLRDNCETIVWTAGMDSYADAVVGEIDKHCTVSHTISRNSTWLPHGKKDVKLLNRDLDRLILIDNTPDAIRGNEQNSLLVEDYEGGELEDTTLCTLVSLLKDLTYRITLDPSVTVPQYIKNSPRVIHRSIPTDSGEYLECPCLAPDYAILSASFPFLLEA